MAFTTAKLSELPFLHNSVHLRSHFLLLKPFCSTSISPSASLRTRERDGRRSHKNLNNKSTKTSGPSAPWLNKWPASENPQQDTRTRTRPPPEKKPRKEEDRVEHKYFDGNKGKTSIERIVHRLRNLGLDSEAEDGIEDDIGLEGEEIEKPLDGDEKLGDLLQRNWSRPDMILDDDDDEEEQNLLPWERGESEREEEENGKSRRARAPSLAELTIEDVELRRLRTLGMRLKDRINVAKAGVTQLVLEKIHDKWRKEELVRLKFHESLAHDMKTAHQIVERRTRGLVIWRSGSVMVVYRGSNYERPSRSRTMNNEGDTLFVPDISPGDNVIKNDSDAITTSEKMEPSLRNPNPVENMTEEEVEYNSLLDGLGPRFVDWWGTGVLPIDADLLPPTIPGYKTPFRLLPTGMRSRLTNAEMTNLRKLAKSLPSHFSLGRNRNHQGLASAIVKLWEKSLIAKIAVKRGIQNTNNKIMSEELKKLTGGILLLRNKYYIVIYRGKDFLPTSVAATLAERQELTKEIQDVEEKVRIGSARIVHSKKIEEKAIASSLMEICEPNATEGQELPQEFLDVEEKAPTVSARTSPSKEFEEKALAGTLAEFYEAQSRWGREVSSEELNKMKEEASQAKNAKIVRRIEHKLATAQTKQQRAERLLAKIEASMIPASPCDDQETLTDEERFMFRRVGLRMKAYLPMGIRGVFDGVIENMHLHWKHRELVKLLSKQKTLSFVEDTARLLEYESGGILVAIERVPKGYALIYYRGKNYQRPLSLRPRNLLTKAKALKRSVSMQRHEALSQHISELERTIEQMTSNIDGNTSTSEEVTRSSHVSESEDEDSSLEHDNDDDGDDYSDNDVDDDDEDYYDEKNDWTDDEESDSS